MPSKRAYTTPHRHATSNSRTFLSSPPPGQGSFRSMHLPGHLAFPMTHPVPFIRRDKPHHIFYVRYDPIPSPRRALRLIWRPRTRLRCLAVRRAGEESVSRGNSPFDWVWFGGVYGSAGVYAVSFRCGCWGMIYERVLWGLGDWTGFSGVVVWGWVLRPQEGIYCMWQMVLRLV